MADSNASIKVGSFDNDDYLTIWLCFKKYVLLFMQFLKIWTGPSSLWNELFFLKKMHTTHSTILLSYILKKQLAQLLTPKQLKVQIQTRHIYGRKDFWSQSTVSFLPWQTEMPPEILFLEEGGLPGNKMGGISGCCQSSRSGKIVLHECKSSHW